MTPPCYTFPAAELTERVQLDVHGRQRKMPFSEQGSQGQSARQPKGAAQTQETDERTIPGGKPSSSRHSNIDLVRDCELLSSMVQYSCAVMHPEVRGSPIRCWPIQRLFRKCQDRNGSFTVETTAWEGTHGTGTPPLDSIDSKAAPASNPGAA